MTKFTGMWKLVKYESVDSSTGKWYDTPSRIGYSGYIMYDGKGHMGVQLLPPGYKELNMTNSIDSLNSDELQRIVHLYSRSFEYFANCNINIADSSIEHHRVSSNNPKEWGTTLIRKFDFRGDTLILTAKELIGGLKTRLRWVKI